MLSKLWDRIVTTFMFFSFLALWSKIKVIYFPAHVWKKKKEATLLFWMPEHTEKIRVNKFNSCALWNSRQPPGQGKIPLRQPSAVPALSPWKFLTRRSSLWSLSTPPHSSGLQAKTHNEVANLPDNKQINPLSVWNGFL